jgi:hypothetical protein
MRSVRSERAAHMLPHLAVTEVELCESCDCCDATQPGVRHARVGQVEVGERRALRQCRCAVVRHPVAPAPPQHPAGPIRIKTKSPVGHVIVGSERSAWAEHAHRLKSTRVREAASAGSTATPSSRRRSQPRSVSRRSQGMAVTATSPSPLSCQQPSRSSCCKEVSAASQRTPASVTACVMHPQYAVRRELLSLTGRLPPLRSCSSLAE